MEALLIVFGYVAVWLVYGWRLALRFRELAIREYMRKCPRLYPTVAKAARDVSLVETCALNGFTLALFWPLVMPARGLYRLFVGRGLLVTRLEREAAKDEELKALREQAKKLDLPMPGSEE